MGRRPMNLLCILLLMTVYSSAQKITIDVQPKEQLLRVGDPYTLVCKVGVPIESCRIEIPTGQAFRVKPGLRSDGMQYYGEGLNKGDCGVRFDKSTAQFNGQFKCSIGTEAEIEEVIGVAKLTIASPPQTPELSVIGRKGDTYREHELLDATCVVRDGRPAANISWYLGDDRVFSSQAPQVYYDRNKDLYGIGQNFTKNVAWQDHGKKLRCVSSHIGQKNDVDTVTDIRVLFGPVPVENEIKLYGFEEGKEGIIDYKIHANPQPRIQWTVNGRKLEENEDTNEYVVRQAELVDPGTYSAKLIIKEVSPSDINKEFILMANNDEGNSVYNIRISTSPAASETDLGTTAIVFIIIAVLIVFLAIILFCVAYMRRMWCFAAGVPPARSDKESGGSIRKMWNKINPKYDGVSTKDEGEELPPIQINLPPETTTNESERTTTRISTSSQDEIESGGALHSSDTESADRVPADATDNKKLKFKLPAFPFGKNKSSTSSKQSNVPLEEVKFAPSTQDAGKNNDTVVYAELDLSAVRKPGEIPVIRKEEDKTEYAEIIHTKKP